MQIHLPEFTMGYDEQGSGHLVLLIHGYPLNRRMWEPQLSGLSGLARLIAPDLRGHGESTAPPGQDEPYSMGLHAADCAALLDALGIDEPVVLCGLSMGGYICFAFYRNYPERVRAAILVATRAVADSAEGKANRDKAVSQAREGGVVAISESMLPKLLSPKTYSANPDLVAQVRRITLDVSLPAIVGDLLGMKERPDSSPTLSEMHLPLLIIHGTNDQLIAPEEARSMQQAAPHARFELIPDAGHLPNLEQPQAFNAAVSEFLHSI